jgi:type II secretory pathway predicted ATPase ExeA
MYEAFYGLASKPFQLNPDPAFYFASKQHRRAKAYLEYGVSRNEGFIVITGEIGAGKTMVLRSLIEGLNGSNVITGHLVTTQLGAEVQRRAMALATILEPLLIVVMGVVVMLIVLAVLLPIIQLNTWVK